jgi:hypothetical protein
MPEQWNMALYCPIQEKVDKTICSNYSAIALIDVVYKVSSKVINKRLEPHMEDVVGSYQAIFRRNKSTRNQIFAMKQILDQCYEYDTDTHCIFIYFKQAFDSPDRNEPYKSLYNVGISRKLIHSIKESLTNAKGKVGNTRHTFRRI